MTRRSKAQKILDFATFPIRALTLIEDDFLGLSSLRSERFDYCASEVQGYCLDVGCGKHNWFVTHYLQGNGKGIDVFPYEGLTEEHLVENLTRFPFPEASFDSVTFIANLNHIPEPMRDTELKEAFRCLKPGGNIIATMGEPLTEILAHALVWLYDRILGTKFDIDNIRGMQKGESYYLSHNEIAERLRRAGFCRIAKKRFWTQWGINAMYIGWKVSDPKTTSL